MSPQLGERVTNRLALVAGAVGAVVLGFGWWLDVAEVRSLFGSLASMKPNTALGVMLLAFALAPATSRWRLATGGAATLAILLGALTLGEDAFSWRLGIDEALARDPYTPAPYAPGRMSLATATHFVLLGVAALLLRARARWTTIAAQLIALFVIAVCLFVLTGYLYDERAVYRLYPFRSAALHTALTFTVLAIVALRLRPDAGPMRVLLPGTTSGILMRRLFGPILLVPLVVGGVLNRAVSHGALHATAALALFAIANIVLVSAFTWVAASRLRDSEARKTAILETALEGIVSMDVRGDITEMNAEAERMLGSSRSHVIGRPLDDVIVPPRYRGLHRAAVDRYLKTGEKRVMGARLVRQALRADGTEFPAEIAVLETTSGRKRQFTGFIRDLTEQQAAEVAIRRGAELAAENVRIQQITRLKSQFLATMSHELRTPLNAIIGFSQLLHDGAVGPISEAQRGFLVDVLAAAEHLLRLVNDVLDLSRVEAGKLELRPEPLDLATLVEEVVGILRPAAAAKQIRVATELDAAPRDVVADRARLRQVLYNYLANALRFTPEQGTVTVRVRGEDPLSFRLEVADSGPGIAAPDLAKLFAEFQQLPGAPPGGTGLGLALTKGLAEAQGGEVGVQSEVGRGSTFHVVLPRQPAPTPLPPPRTRFGPRSDAPALLLLGRDDAAHATSYGALGDAGFAIEIVASPTQLAARARSGGHVAIVVDGHPGATEALGAALELRGRPVIELAPPLDAMAVVRALGHAGITAGPPSRLDRPRKPDDIEAP